MDISILLTNHNLYFQVKNKAPAEIQITAEQLLREAKERDLEILPPVSKIIDNVPTYISSCIRPFIFFF
jgi:hypothetical protein